MPGATDKDLYWSYQFLSGALTLTVAETGRLDRLSHGTCKSSDAEAATRMMPLYAAAGFRMLCSANQRAAKAPPRKRKSIANLKPGLRG